MRIRTGYSFRVAFGNVEDCLDRIKAIGWKHAPISDHFSTFGWVTWNKEAKKRDLIPVWGVQIPVTTEPEGKKPPIDDWSFFAKDDIKYVNYVVGDCNPKGLLSYKQAMAFDGVYKIAGEAALLDAMQPQPGLFLALSPAMPKGLYAEAKARGFNFVASSCNYYPTEDQREAYRVMLGKRSATQTYPMHILSDEEWDIACEYIAPPEVRAEALAQRDALMGLSNAALKRATLLTPDKPKTLREMCEDGAKRKRCNIQDPVYAARLDRELSMIAEKKFEDYFYIIADLVAYAKRFMVVGPARGSSCGSLVCYLLDITAIDPIPFNLLFERFIDINRADLPDIDLDFSDVHREKVFEYARKKYGTERVARLGTVTTFQPKSILKQAGIGLRIPQWRIEELLASMIVRSSGDARANNTIEDTLKETIPGQRLYKDFPNVSIINKVEGHPNVSSQHAAGIVVTQEPVENFVAIDKRTYSTMCDKYDAEALNLLKIDALGLTQLSVFERTLELIGEKPISGFLEQVPFDDPAAFEVLNKQHYAGIFQFMGHALQSLARVVNRIETLEDIISLTALARPGPMATGNATLWARRRNGQDAVRYPHDAFKPFLEGSLGIVIYQEQVMQIGRELGDLSWEDVTALRKAMSKSLGKEFFNQYGDRWKAGAARRGISTDILDKVWDDLCAYGSWSFNRSHAVAYGIVSYWCCWLKAHHPLEFAAATLDAEFDTDKRLIVLRELAREGIAYKPVDGERSGKRWDIASGKLVGPLTAIKGIGPKGVIDILQARSTGAALKPSHQKLLDDPQTDIDSLYPINDRLEHFFARGGYSEPVERVLNARARFPHVQIRELPGNQECIIMGVLKRIRPRDENDAQSVAKRGYKLRGNDTICLYLVIADDSDEILCKVDRQTFARLAYERNDGPIGDGMSMQDLAQLILEQHGQTDKCIFAAHGSMPADFRMFKIKSLRYICDMED